MTSLAKANEIIWDDIDVLRPGMDHKGDTTYVTIPKRMNVTRTVGKGDKAREITEVIPTLICVTSNRHAFPFTPENVEALGFAWPEHVIVSQESRWSSESIKRYLDQQDAEPSPVALFNSLRAVYESYIEFSNEAFYDVMPIFVMGTYMFRLYKSIGYLHFNGTAASGKSQNLRILDALAFNTEWASSMSSAALYRSIAGHPGTVCIDEAEGWEGERGEELRRILNAGYLDGSTVKRAEKGKSDNFVVTSFETYGPKAIASINPLDNVIGSRCLIVSMRPAIRTIREFNKDDERWQKLRDRLYLWMMYNSADMMTLIEDWNDNIRQVRAPFLIGRQWQISQMYVTIADYLDREDKGDRCDRLLMFFKEYFESMQRQQDATDRIRLLLRVLPEVLRTKTAFDGNWYSLKAIHEVISQYVEEDAKEYYKTRQVSKQLETLGFKKRRANKAGQQVWLEADAIRQEFQQRRVEPQEDDKAWFEGAVQYDSPTEVVTSVPRDDIWANVAEEED